MNSMLTPRMQRKLRKRPGDLLLRSARLAAAAPTLHELLRELPKELKRDDRIPKLLARAIVLAFVLPLYGKPLQQKIGMGLTYQRLFGNALSVVTAIARTQRADVLAEVRKLLRVGTQAYVSSALREIGTLFQENG